MLNQCYKNMEGGGGKWFSTFSHILKRGNRGIQDGKVKEEDVDEQP